jgi:hypothetical protein
MPEQTLESVLSAAHDFKQTLRARAGVTDPNDKRSCKELLAHGMVEHRYNKLLVQAAEIIDDFLLIQAG